MKIYPDPSTLKLKISSPIRSSAVKIFPHIEPRSAIPYSAFGSVIIKGSLMRREKNVQWFVRNRVGTHWSRIFYGFHMIHSAFNYKGSFMQNWPLVFTFIDTWESSGSNEGHSRVIYFCCCSACSCSYFNWHWTAVRYQFQLTKRY